MLSLLGLLACVGSGDGSDDTAALSGDLVMTDASNYRYTGTLDVDAVPVTAGQDANVDWSALDADLRGRSIVASEMDQALLVAFVSDQEEILANIANNDLAQSDVADYRLFQNTDGRTSVALSEFSVLGNDFDPASELVDREGVGSRAVLLQREVDDRMDSATLVFLDVVDSGGEATVVVDDLTARLDFQAQFGDPLQTRAGLSYTLDWSAVTLDGGGGSFDPLRADRLFVGHVAEEGEAELQAEFLTLLDEADQIYHEDVYAETWADLGLATDASGASFPGFSEGGTWLVGVECTVCPSPAPVLLSRVAL